MIRTYFANISALAQRLDYDKIEELAHDLALAWNNDKQVFLIGNAGSHTSCSHICNDLQKNIKLECGKCLKAICPTDNTALLMAWSNDVNYEIAIQEQIDCLANPGDLVIALSCSGNSKNILYAVNKALAKGCKVYGLTGFSGGELRNICSTSIHVPVNSMQQAEDLHLAILHSAFLKCIDIIKHFPEQESRCCN